MLLYKYLRDAPYGAVFVEDLAPHSHHAELLRRTNTVSPFPASQSSLPLSETRLLTILI
jgi:hypothetical protein